MSAGTRSLLPSHFPLRSWARDCFPRRSSDLNRYERYRGLRDVPREARAGMEAEAQREYEQARADFAGRAPAVAEHFLTHTDYPPANEAFYFVLEAVGDEEAALLLIRALTDPPRVESDLPLGAGEGRGSREREVSEVAAAIEAVLVREPVSRSARGQPSPGSSHRHLAGKARWSRPRDRRPSSRAPGEVSSGGSDAIADRVGGRSRAVVSRPGDSSDGRARSGGRRRGGSSRAASAHLAPRARSAPLPGPPGVSLTPVPLEPEPRPPVVEFDPRRAPPCCWRRWRFSRFRFPGRRARTARFLMRPPSLGASS